MERLLALKILLKYYQEGSYLNITINQFFKEKQYNKEIKDFVTRVVYGTVQNQLYIQYQLAPFIQGQRVKVFERTLLYMSLYQHYFMDKVPDYAIINEAVDIAKKNKGVKTASFINAVLNNALKNERSLDELDEDTRLSIETSHPLWLVKMLNKQYGKQTTALILKASNEVPQRCARVNTLLISRDELIQSYPEFIKSELSIDGVYFKSGNIAHSEAYKKGYVTIQDESSQLIARLLNPNSKDRLLDMCAAPGSKTMHLAALMNNQGIIEANDLYAHKMRLIEANKERLHISNVHLNNYDALCLDEHFEKESFTKILLDGPCSGLGVLSRKPEIKYHDSSVMDEVIPLQKKMLEKSYHLLQKGGKIVYSTCTINKKENEKQIEDFIKNHSDMKVLEEKTILPYMYHSDGFYMCLMEKEK